MKKIYISFINFFFFILIPVTISACGGNNEENRENIPGNNINVKPGMNLVGRIQDDTTPIEGVVVSDGYTTAVTDSNGVYQIKANNNAEFVFVSIPANCEVPVSNGFPAFYQPIKVKGDEVLYKNFSLKKAPVKNKLCA